MATATSEYIARIHQLDCKYQQGLHAIELINRDETDRRLSLEALTLRDANAALEDLASQKELHILCLEGSIRDLEAELSETKLRSSEQESGLKKQQDEIRSLKNILENLSSSKEVLNSTLQDKAALTDELKSLRRELGQLESQLASHQAVVASNGDLRRQINTLEVDLENEKRLRLRAQQEDEKGIISELRSKLQQCEAQLGTERKEKETLRRELTDCHAEAGRQEERFHNMKAKLKGLQNALKDAQEDLQRSQRERCKIRETSAHAVEESKAQSPKAKQAQLRAETQAATAALSLDDADIQSPGNKNPSDAQEQRRRGKYHTAVGKRSNFSITPFLNKTRDVTDYPDLDSDSSTSSRDLAASLKRSRERNSKTSQEMSPAKSQRPAARRRKPSASLAKAGAMTENVLSQSLLNEPAESTMPVMRKRARLDKPTEVMLANSRTEDSRKKDSDSHTSSQKPEIKPNASIAEGDKRKEQEVVAEGQKKKRKLLGGRGKTMFDDDEMEVNDNPNNPLRVARVKRGRSQLGGNANAFSGPSNTFSPLKKERRGVNASFIG